MAYLDTSVQYDDKEHSDVCIRHVIASHTNDIYVLDSVRTRLTEFSKQTFWLVLNYHSLFRVAYRGPIFRNH